MSWLWRAQQLASDCIHLWRGYYQHSPTLEDDASSCNQYHDVESDEEKMETKTTTETYGTTEGAEESKTITTTTTTNNNNNDNNTTLNNNTDTTRKRRHEQSTTKEENIPAKKAKQERTMEKMSNQNVAHKRRRSLRRQSAKVQEALSPILSPLQKRRRILQTRRALRSQQQRLKERPKWREVEKS